ncbi:MAG: urea ABC transporter permease subunit UrtC, partial [Cyanobacteria bacterium P01_A01_bin.17]
LSEQFPQVRLFFLGGLFLTVVTVLPDGFVGWIRTKGVEQVRSRLGRRRLLTYPSLSEDPEVEYERQNLRN